MLCINRIDIPINFPRYIELIDEDAINNGVRASWGLVDTLRLQYPFHTAVVAKRFLVGTHFVQQSFVGREISCMKNPEWIILCYQNHIIFAILGAQLCHLPSH